MSGSNKLKLNFFHYNQYRKSFETVTKSSFWFPWVEIICKTYCVSQSKIFPDVVILFVVYNDLCSSEFFDELATSNIRKKSPLPVITISNYSNNELFGEENSKEKDNEKNKIDKCVKYLDSSIWNYFIGLDEVFSDQSEGKKEDKSKECNGLKNILDSMHNYRFKKNDNTVFDLYQTNVAKEYVEFYSRLLLNSKLTKIGGHAKDIKPFIFHSEAEMRSKFTISDNDKGESLLKKLQSNNYKWKILLIDDHITEDKPLSPFDNNETKEHTHLIKQNIVSAILKEDNWSVQTVGKNEPLVNIEDYNIHIVSVIDIKSAIEKLKNETYDIILLDFLLGFVKDNNNNQTRREFGHELLSEIQNDEDLKLKKNPLNYYWCLIMSAFPQAFLYKLREQGLSHHSNHWHLARGADPINTPELFKYSLYNLMNLQISEVDYSKKDISTHFKQYFNNDIIDIRSWAKSYYQIFISKFGKIHILKNNPESFFSTSFCNYFTEFRKGDLIYYEKMRNFLFLLANGSANDSGQLQMSYIEVSKEIDWSEEEKKSNKENRLIHYIDTMNSRNFN